MNIFNYSKQVLSLGMLFFLLGACTQVQSAGQEKRDQYSYQLDANSDWKITAARMTSANNKAYFTAKIFHRHKRAIYPAADLQLHIIDVSGKLLGTATAKPERIFDGEKAWRKTGVDYQATLDFVPPPGSQIQLLIAQED